MRNGFTKIPNTILDLPWGRNPIAVYLYTWLSLHADDEGKVVTSLRQMSKFTKLSIQQIRTAMGKLLSTQVVTQVVTQGSTQVTTIITISYLSGSKPSKSTSNTSSNTSCNTSSNTPRAYKNDNINIMSMEELKEEPPISPNGGKRDSSKFIKPTIDEVVSFVIEKNYHFDAVEFWNFYESKGWMVGRNKMKDWKAACVTWERSWKKRMSESLPLGFTLKDNSTTKYDNDKTKRW